MTQAPAIPSLVERLRDERAHEGERVSDIMVRWNAQRKEAAEALETQQARIAELEDALKPFAEAARTLSSRWDNLDTDWQSAMPRRISVGKLRAADQALSSQGRNEGGARNLKSAQFTPVSGLWKDQRLSRLERVRAHRWEFKSGLKEAIAAIDEESGRQSMVAKTSPDNTNPDGDGT